MKKYGKDLIMMLSGLFWMIIAVVVGYVNRGIEPAWSKDYVWLVVVYFTCYFGGLFVAYMSGRSMIKKYYEE